MDNKTLTSLQTKTAPAVKISVAVMMMGALVIGAGFGFAMFQSTRIIPELEPEPVIVTPVAMTTYGIDDATVQIDPATTHASDSFDLIYIKGVRHIAGITEYPLLASFDISSNPGFISGDTLTEQTPLVIEIPSETHPAMIISAELDLSGPGAASKLFGIPTAQAQVNISFPEGICIPEKSSNELSRIPQEDSFSFIPAAKAQVNINSNLCTDGEINGCYLCSNNTWQWDETIPGCGEAPVSRYFVDENGNVFNNETLTDQVDTTECAAQLANGYAPDDINNVLYTSATHLHYDIGSLAFAKTWSTVLGYFEYFQSTQQGTYNDLFTDSLARGPLFITGINQALPDGQSIENDVATLTIVDNQGLQNLCLPALTLSGQEWFYFFYDANGTPYYDMSLTQPATLQSCAVMLANTLTLNSLTDAEVDMALPVGNVAMSIEFKRDNTTMGTWSTNSGYIPNSPTPYQTSAAPLEVKYTNYNEANTFPEGAVVLTTPSGTYNLCLPTVTLAAEIEPGDIQSFFYDSSGNPYSDAWLQDAVSCGESTGNQCSDISCDKFPNHACCIVVQQADEEPAL